MKNTANKNKPSVTFKAALFIFLTVALIASALPQFNAGAVTCKFKHTVQQGETLIYIANLYGVSWEKIADASNLKPPYTIAVGQKLCIPEGQKPADTKKDLSKEAKMQVFPGINRLLLSVENFSKKTSYFVRVFPSKQNISFRIGHFTTNKEGDFTGWFRVPYFVLRSPTMTLCIKNAWTDQTYCIKYGDIWTDVPLISGRCQPKEGR